MVMQLLQPTGGNGWHKHITNIVRTPVIVAGEPCVGKTSIVQALLNGTPAFANMYTMTCSNAVHVKLVTPKQSAGSAVELALVDTASAALEWDETTVTHAWPDAATLCLVYDVTSEKSFDALQKWVDMLQAKTAPNTKGVLLGNKCDLEIRTRVSDTAAQQWAAQHNMAHYRCSAKECINVAEAFHQLAVEQL